MKKHFSLLLISFLIANGIKAQGLLNKSENNFTRQDSLRGSITKERILKDLPNLLIQKEKRVLIGEGINALSFESEMLDIGPTYEIWFVHKGFIYQARTYRDFGPIMEEILKTWKFK